MGVLADTRVINTVNIGKHTFLVYGTCWLRNRLNRVSALLRDQVQVDHEAPCIVSQVSGYLSRSC
jgi:hypothetical protein